MIASLAGHLPRQLKVLAVFGGDTGLAQLVGDDFGGMLGGDKHQRAAQAFALDQMAQQLGSPSGIDFDYALNNIGRRLRDIPHFYS